MEIGSLIAVFGLMLDILGAWYISRAIFKKTLDAIKEEAPKFSAGINEAYVVGALHQRIEAKFGFPLLSIGFFLQAVPNFLCEEYKSAIVSTCWFLLGVIIIVTLRFILEFFVKNAKTKLVKSFLKAYIIENYKKKNLNEPMPKKTVESYFIYLEKKYTDSASQEELWEELRKLLGIL